MKNTKAIGTVTALEFAVECVKRGVIVSEPIGDYAPYDYIVDVLGKLYKIQVKTAYRSTNGHGFIANGRRSVPQVSGPSSKAVAYGKGQVDLLVTRAESVWYIIPNVHLLASVVILYPNRLPRRSEGIYECYKERWDLLGLTTGQK